MSFMKKSKFPGAKPFKKGGASSSGEKKFSFKASGESAPTKKYADGGTVSAPSGSGMRGTGCAIKGKKFSGVY